MSFLELLAIISLLIIALAGTPLIFFASLGIARDYQSYWPLTGLLLIPPLLAGCLYTMEWITL